MKKEKLNNFFKIVVWEVLKTILVALGIMFFISCAVCAIPVFLGGFMVWLGLDIFFPGLINGSTYYKKDK